jgi:heat shock protein HslJ
MKSYLSLCVLLLILAGCSTSKKNLSSTAPKPPVKTMPAPASINGIWVLERLNNIEVSTESYTPESPKVEIKSTDKTYTGYSGCNRFNGSLLELNSSAIQFGPGPMTRMACTEDNIESAFLKALFSTKTYSIENGKLHLLDENAKTTCVFKNINK